MALLVVWLTNKHQGKLAAAALRVQTRQAKNALTAQMDALGLQLKEQRDEAARVRVFAAISDLVAAVELGKAKYREGDIFDDSFVAMRSAVSRWSLDLDSKALKGELVFWPTLLWSLQREAHIDSLRVKEGLPTFDEDGAAADRLMRASTTLTHSVVSWPSASDELKIGILHRLATRRAEYDRHSSAMRGKMAAR